MSEVELVHLSFRAHLSSFAHAAVEASATGLLPGFIKQTHVCESHQLQPPARFGHQTAGCSCPASGSNLLSPQPHLNLCVILLIALC